MVMMNELLPVGIKGLMAAGLLAALMSTIEAALNSTATLTSEDIVRRWRPKTSDANLVLIGRITAGVVVVLAMLCWWVYFHRMGGVMKSQVSDVSGEIAEFKNIEKKLTKASKRHTASVERVDKIADIVSIRTRWNELISTVHECMQEGMWVVALEPRGSATQINEINLTVQGFSDRLIDDEAGTSTERFRDRLRATEFFSDKSDIISANVIFKSSVRRFTIKLELEQPILK
jgi:hypothetical protein